jgi:acyl carrier protein
MITRDQIVDDLAGILRHFQGRCYTDEIGPETLFFDDLGFVSIDAIVLGEKVQTYYGQEFPYREFLAEMKTAQVLDIQIGQLAAFLQRNLQPQPIED